MIELSEQIHGLSDHDEDDNIKKPVPAAITAEQTAPEDLKDDEKTWTDRHYGVAELRRLQRSGLQSVTEFPRWLRINLLLSDISVFVMFAVALANLAFAGVMKEDLEDDSYDYTCDSYYIRDAAEPAAGYESWRVPDHGQYHNDCRRLYLSTFPLLVAGSFSLLRVIPICFFPVQKPSRFTIRYRPEGLFDRLTTPSRIYALRTFFSTVPAALYLFGLIVIATSRFMTGPPTEDSYKSMYVVSLALLGFSALASVYQAVTTAYAGLMWKMWRQS